MGLLGSKLMRSRLHQRWKDDLSNHDSGEVVIGCLLQPITKFIFRIRDMKQGGIERLNGIDIRERCISTILLK